MAVEYAQCQLVTETTVYLNNESNSVKLLIHCMVIFVFFSYFTWNRYFKCYVQQWGWEHKKGKAGKENYTAAVDILINLPFIHPVGVSPVKTLLCMKQANNCISSMTSKNHHLNFRKMHIYLSSSIILKIVQKRDFKESACLQALVLKYYD